MYKIIFKRALDFLLALIGLILFFPIIIIISICLLFYNNGKPFFIQERPGKHEKIFKIIKFKSMTDKKDAKGKLLPDEQRMTRFGSLLRKTSLDEIPQLFNVLIGDMSFIGPRPLRVHYIPYYTKEESIRHTIRPGITGLAQVSGRNLLNWDEKLLKDIEYVKTISFSNDFVIFLKTIKKVFIYHGIELDPNTSDLAQSRKQNNNKEKGNI
jgi:lipopolysaccharide/colanic/teichoic acid biosynthesis glycosyltransferase